MLVYKWDIFFFDIKCWIVVQFSLVTEVYAFCLVFENLKPFSVAHLLILLMLCCSFLLRVGMYFDL